MPTDVPVLRAPAHRVSPRAQLVWATAGLVRALLVAGALVVITLLWHWFSMPGWGWWAYGAASLGYCMAMPAWRYRVHRWEATAGAVYTQTGWLGVERRVAPMSRVQTVDVVQGPVSRMLWLATVTVTTASARGPLHIEGLTGEVAARLAAELSRRAEQDPGDAT